MTVKRLSEQNCSKEHERVLYEHEVTHQVEVTSAGHQPGTLAKPKRGSSNQM